jgi:hypothetical protein
MHKKLVACAAAAALALVFACSKNPEAPAAPGGATPDASDAAADGSTLKVTAPTPQSPVNNAQQDVLLLTAGTSTGRFVQGMSFSYEFEIRNAGNNPVCNSGAIASSGSTVSYSPTCTLDFDAPHTWRVRAVRGTSFGPWSSAATFRSPAGGFIRNNEVFDPLTNGRTVGDIRGAVEFSAQGAKLVGHDSHIRYALPQNLQEGEFSLMVLGADEGSPGDKSKILAMQEGPDEGDITDDDYRMTAELRGRNYGAPGSVTFRIIPGDGEPRDGHREAKNFSSSRWYFWRFSWRTGVARLEVREDNRNGRALYDTQIGTGTHPYRPVPHYVYIGAPVGRAGPIDATLPGGIYKNVWVSPSPRPNFPE